jgi:predicted GNAT family N-acyltransferase
MKKEFSAAKPCERVTSRIVYGYATTDQELEQILTLQEENHFTNVDLEEREAQGFVSIKHDFATLKKMCEPYYHVVAKDGDKVAGFALVMQREHEKSIPLLVPMFAEINEMSYKGELLKNVPYYIMGQVCVAKEYRGLGIFDGLYQKLKEQTKADFKYLITEISAHNKRSQKAHARVGFKTIREYRSEADHKDWQVVLWDWS